MKSLTVIALLVLATVWMSSCLPLPQETSNPPREVLQESAAGSTDLYEKTVILVATESGQTALELLESRATIETQEYGDAGAFVTSINGLAGDNQNYWAFYLNGEYSQTGASQTILEPGDEIKFVYEEIQPY